MIASGELIRWYVRSARHPFKQTILGRYWGMFCRRPWWIRYGTDQVILAGLSDYIQQRIFLDGYYERGLVEWLKKELRPDDVFWDVGANIGAMTLVASPRCRTVVAFEPEPRTLAHLRLNIAANKLSNIVVVDAALSNQDGSVALCPGPESNTGMNSICRTSSDRAPVSVRASRADTLIEVDGIPRSHVMKIDVEGAEELVLQGADALLSFAGLRAIVFESQEATGDLPANQSLSALLKRHGFQIEGFGRSDLQTADGMNNYLATRAQ
jgi:FkbM family methyltransferase